MMNANKGNGDVQVKYKELIPERRFAELALLMEASQTTPADYIVRMGFKAYIEEHYGNKVKLFYIMKLKEITGVSPENEILKAACEIALGMNNPEILESLINRLEIDKTFFRELVATLQKIFSTYVQEGRFVDISKLMEITEIKPLETTIHEGYRSYLQECKFISFSGLKKRTGIKPDEEMVQEMYRQYQGQYLLAKSKKNEEAISDWENRIKKLERISKIKPTNPIIIKDENPT
jgi:hypothetical protein